MNEIIVIPIYKKDISQSEAASLKQCAKILGNYPITIVCPESLDVTNYKNILENACCTYNFLHFNEKYFKSIEAYSKLLLKKDFYKKFDNYKFMLIYQLDAWVFRNELEYWCQQDYDYIGAPWFEGFGNSNENSPLMKINGNGGFSLRKIPTMINLLSINYKKNDVLKELRNKKRKLGVNLVNLFFGVAKTLSTKRIKKTLWQSTNMYEDHVIATYGPELISDFKAAPPEIAMKFSFEVQPRRLYELNKFELPFGCHAFEKYDFDFWKPFINIKD